MPLFDPLAAAECRRPGRDPAMWDVDANEEDRVAAATLCDRCPVITGCATARAELGDLASGTWAGEFYEHHHRADDDDSLAAFSAVFGESFDPTASQSQHPAQMMFDFTTGTTVTTNTREVS